MASVFVRERAPRPPAVPDGGPLARAHPHERDAQIAFTEEAHEYYRIVGQDYLLLRKSVSGLYKQYFEEFDGERMSRQVASKRKLDRSSPYYWLIQSQADPNDEERVAAEIRRGWSALGDRAAADGTAAHKCLEDYMNDQAYEVPAGASVRERRVGAMARAGVVWIDARLKEGWVPYRSEWSLFIDGAAVRASEDGDPYKNHERLIAGQLDALFYEPASGEYHLADWKFCGEAKLDKRSGEFRGKVPTGRAPLGGVPDNSYGHYLAQQSIYAYVLKRRYGIRVASARLVHIPSDVENPVAREVCLELLADETVEALFEEKVG